jgi:hypothetical protein
MPSHVCAPLLVALAGVAPPAPVNFALTIVAALAKELVPPAVRTQLAHARVLIAEPIVHQLFVTLFAKTVVLVSKVRVPQLSAVVQRASVEACVRL